MAGCTGKLYVYELRAMKTPKHVLEAHCGAVTCIAEQNSVKVRKTINFPKIPCPHAVFTRVHEERFLTQLKKVK